MYYDRSRPVRRLLQKARRYVIAVTVQVCCQMIKIHCWEKLIGIERYRSVPYLFLSPLYGKSLIDHWQKEEWNMVCVFSAYLHKEKYKRMVLS